MKIKLFILSAISLFVKTTIALATVGLLQFNGPAPATVQYLAQQFPTPVEIWATVLENSSYVGASLRVHRTDNDVETDIGFSGKDASVSAFNTACSGTTCLLAKFYGQMGTTDCVQATKANMPTVSVASDSKLQITGGSTKWCASTNTALKVATPHVFGIFYPGYTENTSGGPTYYLWAYDGANGLRFGLGLWPYNNGNLFPTFNNTNVNDYFYSYGQAHLGGTTGFHVWDTLQTTQTIRHDAVNLNTGVSSASVTYPATNSFFLGNDNSGDATSIKYRGFVLYSSARADRNSISNFLISDFGVTTLPSSATTADGFVWQPQYFPTYNFASADIFGLAWSQQGGGYEWSLYHPTNLSSPSTTTLTRFEVRPGDDAMLSGIDGTERSEQATDTKITPGQDFEIFAQFRIETGSAQTGDWADIFQVHYGTGEVAGSPDLIYISVLNNNFQVITTKDGGQTNQGSAIPFSRNTWYGLCISGHTSVGHTTDTLKVWLSANGSTLTQIVNVGSSGIFNSNTWDGYLKNGIYRGFPNSNTGTLAMEVANYQFTNTINSFCSGGSNYVTTQPALPTHP